MALGEFAYATNSNRFLGAPALTIGMDCVEVAPAYDHAELTSQAAASFIWTYLCGQIAKQSPTAMSVG